MANMTIENLSGLINSGSIESIVDRNRSVTPVQGDPTAVETEHSFSSVLKKSIDEVNQEQLQADRAVKELAVGRNKNIHETMLLIEKADMSFRMLMQVRNKLLDAYREIMRMQV